MLITGPYTFADGPFPVSLTDPYPDSSAVAVQIFNNTAVTLLVTAGTQQGLIGPNSAVTFPSYGGLPTLVGVYAAPASVTVSGLTVPSGGPIVLPVADAEMIAVGWLIYCVNAPALIATGDTVKTVDVSNGHVVTTDGGPTGYTSDGTFLFVDAAFSGNFTALWLLARDVSPQPSGAFGGAPD